LKQWGKIAITFLLGISFILNGIGLAAADQNTDEDVINEKFGLPIVVYGETLTDEQKDEVRKLLKVKDPSLVEEITVTAKDLARLIDGNPNSRMFLQLKLH